jgi:hypothetical protein
MQPYLLLPFRFDPKRLKADLRMALAEAWTPHFNQSYYEGDWSGVVLRAAGNSSGSLFSNPRQSVDSFAPTPLLDRCPYFREVLAAFQCRLKSVRLLRLKAGSIIKEHTDSDLNEEREIRIHVPVVTNPAVEFYLGGERVVMEEGQCWYLDLSRHHRVQNLGSTDRVHLVIDCVVNDWVKALLSACSVAPAPEMSKCSAERLREFQEMVLQDACLQQELSGITDMREFQQQTVVLGRKHGYVFTSEDVNAAMQENRRAWLERWV